MPENLPLPLDYEKRPPPDPTRWYHWLMGVGGLIFIVIMVYGLLTED